MRTLIKTLFVIVLSFYCLKTNAVSYSFEKNGIYYSINSDNKTVSVVDGPSSGDVIIPDEVTYGKYTVKTYSVTKIAKKAFRGSQELNRVVLGENITIIEDSAFSACGIIPEINIPSQVSYIGYNAFDCHVKKVYWNARNCSESRDRGGTIRPVFKNPMNAFIIGDNVKRIERKIVTGLCDTITLGRSLESVGAKGLPDWPKVLNIQDLKTYLQIKYGDNYELRCPVSFCDKIYVNGVELVDLVIPEGIEVIPAEAFYGYIKLNSVVIPSGVKEIRYRAFCTTGDGWGGDHPGPGYCGLNNVTFPNTLKTIGSYAFYGNQLKSVVLPNSLTTIGECAFARCRQLTSIDFPNSLKSINARAFDYCDQLTSISIPKSVTSISGNPFDFCTKLETVRVDPDNQVYDSRDNCNAIIHTESNMIKSGCKNTQIPNSVKTIGKFAFYHVIFDITVTIPNSVTSIESCAYFGATLPSLIIGSNVSEIGSQAFSNCKNLSEIHCNNIEPPTCDTSSSPFTDYTCLLYVPLSSVEKYKNAPIWKKFKSITGESSGINDIESDKLNIEEIERYDIEGHLLSSPQPGINIVRYSDGSVSKEYVPYN